ncbi:hypothetical protein AcV5_002674 [Taiwanofungus camphoratus]|nr:hypothetical protein AcV5_002674 [Antrodia cinnamomea]
MVVTRRAPAPPVPTSRTSSSQRVPQTKGNAPQGLSNVPDISSPLANGTGADSEQRAVGTKEDDTDNSPSKKGSKSRLKSKHKKNGKKTSTSTSMIDLLSRIFLLWFTIYTLSVCPQDVYLQSPVCRGLSEYRRLVIEPYMVPPVRATLEHPSIAPYIEKARPYAERAMRTAGPLVQWSRDEWKWRVVPLWQRHAVPQLQRLAGALAPYRTRLAGEYARRVGPYVRQVSPHARRAADTLAQWQRRARPYVVRAAHRTYDGYQWAAPYAHAAWERVMLLAARLVAILGAQRRQFVDPHVQKIWEHVKELSSGKPAVVDVHVSSPFISAPTHTPEAKSLAIEPLDPTARPIIPENVANTEGLAFITEAASPISSSVGPAEPMIQSLVSDVSTSIRDSAASTSAASLLVSAVSSKLSPLAEAAMSHVSSATSAPSASVDETLSIPSLASSTATDQAVPSASPRGATSGVLSHASEAAVPSAKSAASVLSKGVSSVADQAASSVTSSVTPSSAVQSQAEDTDLDLDAFYAELGLDDETILDASVRPAEPSPVQTESEEERAERQRARADDMAKRRIDVEARHTQWEQQLATQIKINQKALRKALVALRKAAAAELKESRDIRAEVESLVEEAEKYLRGAEKYFVTLEKEGRREEEKKAVWEKVIAKVDQKFAERLSQTEALVNGWYVQVLDKELMEVQKVVDEVKDIADRGQTDIGLDYAYLDDVTYWDWQRYHDLVRTSDNFTRLAHSIQDGSHPSPLINPVLAQIDDLQVEVQDIVVGFETRLRRIKRNGERAFGGGNQDVDAEQEESAEESVSILPINDEDMSQSPSDTYVPPVVVGRSKEEVMDALNRVAEPDGLATSSPHEIEEPQDPDSVVRDLVEESDSLSQSDLHSQSITHEEL